MPNDTNDEARCTEQTPDGPCQKTGGPRGMNICWAHYQRHRRGAKTQAAPIREYGLGLELLTCPALTPEAFEMMRRASKGLATEEFDGSLYEVERKIVEEWLKRYADGKMPYLAGLRAVEQPVTSKHGLRREGSKLALKPEHVALVHKAAREANRTLNNLLVTIFDDWFIYWSETDVPPPGGTAANPYPVKTEPPRAKPRRHKP